MAVEAKRGCGYRKVGGLYIVGGGLSAPCDRMPFRLDRCKTCGGGIKFSRSHTWLQPDFFAPHGLECLCLEQGADCPVCRTSDELGPHLLLWIGRAHYSPSEYLEESGRLGISRRIAAPPKGLVLGETWVLLAHVDAVPVPEAETRCTICNFSQQLHLPGAPADICSSYQQPKATPGIFCAFQPRALELILKEGDATEERIAREKKRGVNVVAVPDDDTDHQGSVWDHKEDEEPSRQEELPGVPA